MTTTPLEFPPLVVAGIDPGGRFTALSVLVENDEDEAGAEVIYSGTFRRPDNSLPIDFVVDVSQEVDNVIADIMNDYHTSTLLVGLEGVNAPKGFVGGKRASLNPAGIIMTGIIAGGLRVTFPEAVIVSPAGNGSQPLETYPERLRGRRPKDLPGGTAGTRNHERSAYDVAMKVLRQSEGRTGRVV